MSDIQETNPQEYRVLARKYRPQNFDELIGQDALVRTLKNAIESGRIAHAFMLTGIRGTGKTTTARIIAKALNYTGADGNAGPTTGPTDDCSICQAITQDRHPDVMEMDAASRTGIDDIREILDGVRYAPTSARYKVYIIDEVHMLSKAAFNALLKTLEEPPEHVKFIFATTEIRKVPVTVLSRCQRFDLRRVDIETLSAHYKKICKDEGTSAEDEAISLIARAADGSVRDGLSLLDQAISLSEKNVTAAQVQDMLGLADQARTLDLLERSLKGETQDALTIMDDLYKSGADPIVILQDLLAYTHILTKLRAIPKLQSSDQSMGKDELERASAIAEKISMPSLGRAWQIILKGLNEANMAPNPQHAAEMIIIRLAYAADLPDPAQLIKKLEGQPSAVNNGHTNPASVESAAYQTSGNAQLAVTPQEHIQNIEINSLQDIVDLCEQNGSMILASEIYQYAHLVKLEPGRLEIRPEPQASARLAQDLTKILRETTQAQWVVSISSLPGQPTLAENIKAQQEKEFANVMQDPLVSNILELFPGSEIKAIHTKKD